MQRPTSVLLATIMVAALVAAGCGDDDDGGGSADGGSSLLEVTLGADSISVPDEVTGRVVEVVFESPTDELEVDFTRVDEGTTVDEFREGIAVVIGGGPFPDFMQTNAGVTAVAEGTVRQHVLLEPGSYMAWVERPRLDDEDEGGDDEGDDEGDGGEDEGGDEEEEALTADDILAQAFTVVAGSDGDLPSTDGTITASDYDFDLDVEAGDRYTFVNDGPEQFHHVVVFNFGDLDPEVVEENFPAFMQGEEDAPPPEAFADVLGPDFEAGGSGVFGQDSAGTFSMTLESGNTYAAVCFISDRSGGPPHAFGHDMWKVFTVD